jgi:hypothetical protein
MTGFIMVHLAFLPQQELLPCMPQLHLLLPIMNSF